MNRPDLKVGDIVRLSHKGAKLFGSLKNKAMTVMSIASGYQHGKTAIQVVYSHGLIGQNKLIKCTFQRRYLWRTGYNCYDAGKSFTIKKKTRFSLANIYTSTAPKFVGQFPPPPTQADLDALIKAYGMPKSAIQPDPQKTNEIKCPICKRMADKGLKCWHCGTQL